MKCPVCGEDIYYLNVEDYGEEGIIYFYECTHCRKIVSITDIEEE